MSKVINVSGQKVKIIKEISKKGNNPFMYLDPPYYPLNPKNPYNLYSAGCNFSPEEFLKLKLRLDEITKEGIPFILSNSDCEFIRLLFKDYIIVEIDEPRGMKKENKKGKRTKEKCLIITNFKQQEDFMKGIKTLNKLSTKKSKNL